MHTVQQAACLSPRIFAVVDDKDYVVPDRYFLPPDLPVLQSSLYPPSLSPALSSIIPHSLSPFLNPSVPPFVSASCLPPAHPPILTLCYTQHDTFRHATLPEAITRARQVSRECGVYVCVGPWCMGWGVNDTSTAVHICLCVIYVGVDAYIYIQIWTYICVYI